MLPSSGGHNRIRTSLPPSRRESFNACGTADGTLGIVTGLASSITRPSDVIAARSNGASRPSAWAGAAAAETPEGDATWSTPEAAEEVVSAWTSGAGVGGAEARSVGSGSVGT